MTNYDDFMSRLHAQASGGEEARIKQDKAIMRVFCSWIDKQTDEYLKARNRGESDGEYLGEKAKRACIDRELAWDCASRFLQKHYNPEHVETLKDGFMNAYDAAEEEEWWRNKYFANVR